MQLFVKDLTVIDASYLCPIRGVVGYSWIVDVVLDGLLDQQSMVLDFGQVKKRLKAIIDEEVDHKLLVPSELSNARVVVGDHDMQWLDFESDRGSIHMYCPSQGLALIPCLEITPQTISAFLSDIIQSYLPKNVVHVDLTLREENISTPSYQYTHGLKKHEGNCQRIAHGHRSMIEIWRNGRRDSELESRWAARWKDIYLASTEDKISVTKLHRHYDPVVISDETHYGFSYLSGQGLFELAMPKSTVEFIETDTTVECLAEFILTQIESWPDVDGVIKVFAYEGVGKGAIATNE